ncbi:hypothetical protein CsSME_00047044 [Camellia sinensis var. sinensis]
MEATLVLQNSGPFASRGRRKQHIHGRLAKHSRPCSILSVLTKPTITTTPQSDDLNQVSSSNSTAAATTTTVYRDSWFDRIAINHLSRSVQSTTGIRNDKSGYESLVEAATMASSKFNLIRQQETNCVGMCINLCKMPSQTFIKDSLGMPVNMVPSKYFMITNSGWGHRYQESAQEIGDAIVGEIGDRRDGRREKTSETSEKPLPPPSVRSARWEEEEDVGDVREAVATTIGEIGDRRVGGGRGQRRSCCRHCRRRLPRLLTLPSTITVSHLFTIASVGLR